MHDFTQKLKIHNPTNIHTHSCYLLSGTVSVDQCGSVLRRVFIPLVLHVAALVELGECLHVRVGEAARGAQGVIPALIFCIIPTQHHKNFISCFLPFCLSITNLRGEKAEMSRAVVWYVIIIHRNINTVTSFSYVACDIVTSLKPNDADVLIEGRGSQECR